MTKKKKANPYIVGPVRCPLTSAAVSNMSRVHIISIDSYPNMKLGFYKYVNADIQIPQGSTIEPKACNKHSNYVAAAFLGVNQKNIPIFRNIKVTFIPAISCIGTAWEPNIVLSLQSALAMAKQNTANNINTVVIYPIGGYYNTTQKLDLINELSSDPRTYFFMSAGNNDQSNACYPPGSYSSVNLIGASANGNKLSTYGDIGDCVDFYTPGKYKSVVDGKIIYGTSYSMPIAGNIAINEILNNPDVSKAQILGKMNSISKTVMATTAIGSSVPIKVFPTATVCSTKITAEDQNFSTPAPKPMLAQFHNARSFTHNPIAVPDMEDTVQSLRPAI